MKKLAFITVLGLLGCSGAMSNTQFLAETMPITTSIQPVKVAETMPITTIQSIAEVMSKSSDVKTMI